jgi:hypothetical protein
MHSPRLALAWLSLLAPTTALADIYMWTDERGGTVISDERPQNPQAVSNFKLLVKESERGPRTEVRVSRQEPTRNEQMLQERVESLERQLQEQRYPPPDLPPANTYSSGYYAVPTPAPAVVYDSGYYPPYYYAPPAYVVLGATSFVSRPFGFGHKHFGHGHFGHKHVGHGHFGHKHFGHGHFHRGHSTFTHGGRGFTTHGGGSVPRTSFAAGRMGTGRR